MVQISFSYAYPLLPDTTYEEPREETPLLVDGETEPSIMTLAATSQPPQSPLKPLMVMLIGKLSIAESENEDYLKLAHALTVHKGSITILGRSCLLCNQNFIHFFNLAPLAFSTHPSPPSARAMIGADAEA